MNDINITFLPKIIASAGMNNYINNAPLLLPFPVCKLPSGSITAKGWLGHQLFLMKNGMTGRLKEISWFLQDDNGWLNRHGYGWEEQPYWFRGYIELAVLLDDKDMLDESYKWIEAILANRDSDGYFGPACNKAVKGANGRIVADIWPHMVMLDALRTFYEYSDDKRIPELILGFFRWCAGVDKDMLIPVHDEGFKDWHVDVQSSRAGDMLPHIYWLYGITKETFLLELAMYFKDKTAPPQGKWLDRHVVNFTQRFRVAANYYIQSKNISDIKETEKWYKMHMDEWGQQPGGIFGADELIRDGKTDPRQAIETCAIAEFNKSFHILSEVTGDPVYADRCEDIMFNSYPATHTPELKALHYLTASNQPLLDFGTTHDYYNKYRQLDYSAFGIYRCCQHNSAMGWPYFARQLWMAADGDGLVAWIYGQCTVNAVVADNVNITINETTDYPFETKIKFELKPEKSVSFPLYLRIPHWAEKTGITINGIQQAVPGHEGIGFYVIDKEWKENDTVELDFGVEIKIRTWHKSGGSVTVDRGPLSYSLKIKEYWQRYSGTYQWPEWQVFPKTPWNYGLVFKTGDLGKDIIVKRIKKPKGQPWVSDDAPIELEAKGQIIEDWGLIDNTVNELPASPVVGNGRTETITLIPMGCARLRISCFPVVSPQEESQEETK